MAPEAATHERIYRTIKADLLAGQFDPHHRIEAQAIAERCSASVTPVREALYRLVGEALIEAHPDRGFRIAVPDGDGLRNLYGWMEQQLLAAVRLSSPQAIRQAMAPFRPRQFSIGDLSLLGLVDDTFEAIGQASGNRELVASIQQGNVRLRSARLAELRVLHDLQDEIRKFHGNGTIDMRSHVKKQIIAYHRIRAHRVADLVHHLSNCA